MKLNSFLSPRLSPRFPARLSHCLSPRGLLFIAAPLTLATLCGSASLAQDSPPRYMVIDGHNDLPWQYHQRFDNRLAELDVGERQDDLEKPLHTDIPRLREGGMGAQFWSVYVPISEYGGTPGDASRVMEQMDVVRRLVERYSDDLVLAYTVNDIRNAHAQGRIASLMGIEGGHAIEDSLGTLRSFYAAGARYMTLTHGKGLRWADSATDEERHGGLTDFGELVVKEMNHLGMLVDLSHVSEAAMHDALDVAVSPVIFSHSSARAVTDHPRNVPDTVLERIPDNGGVVMVTFVPSFVSDAQRLWSAERSGEIARARSMYPFDDEAQQGMLDRWQAANPEPNAYLSDVADHIDHIRDVAGVQHIGLGGDFDGIGTVVLGLEDVSTYPALFAELSRRGYSDADLRAIAGENVLRVMEANEQKARDLQKAGLMADPPAVADAAL